MTELLTAAQMRAVETAAIAAGEASALDLMERAGRGVVEAIFEEWPAMAETARCALVLCGPGNNGGDGFVVARLLKRRGWNVGVFLYGDAGKLPPDARTNYDRWCELGPVYDMLAPVPDDLFPITQREGGVLVDAIFGTGLSRPLAHDLRLRLSDFTSRVPYCFLRPVAVDVPSGVCADSGRALVDASGIGVSIACELTVTFHRPKIGHYLNSAIPALSVKPIGLERFFEQMDYSEMSDDPDDEVSPVDLVHGANALISKAKMGGQHKYSHGHALIVSGPSGKTGAARLAARGALRIGTGLVTVASPPDAVMENAAHLTAVMLEPVADAVALAAILEDRRIGALCLGPALGKTRDTRGMVETALRDGRPLVLDADALGMFAEDPAALFALTHDNVVLTPHGGEFARLFPDLAARLGDPAGTGPAFSKVDATRLAAQRAGCVVLFKGADTTLSDAWGNASINSALFERAAPWLATAGSGDVLAGFITGLMARGFDPMYAAETGAWLHVECALTFGPGLIAEDIPEQMPAVFRALAAD